MNTGRLLAGLLALPGFFTVSLAQAPPPLPVLDDKPVPQVDAGGPSAAVTSLAFSTDGETLYAASLDKVVRVWTLQKGSFVLKTTYRVPIGPGNMGAVNAVALSPDGQWLAMAGRAPMRGEAGFRLPGVIIETAALSREQNLDAGVIYVARTANPAGGKMLRGHQGEVRALAFAPAQGKPPLLVSAATERDGARSFGGLRLWDVDAGKLLAERTDLPPKVPRPGLAVWHTGQAATQVRVAVAWPEQDPKKPSRLHLWDTGPGAVPRQHWPADRRTQTVALLGEDVGARIVTGGFGPDDAGRLLVWRLSADRQTRVSFDAQVLFRARGQVKFQPVSLALVSARDGSPSLAAVILQPSANAAGADADLRLALADLRTNQVVADIPLADPDLTEMPSVAARGPHVAVAATRDHTVRMYAVADLLQGRTKPEAVLAGHGLALRHVAFVDKGHGLWLNDNERAGPLSGGLVFDLDKRQVRANDRANLAKDAPELGEWSVIIDPDWKGVRVRQGQKDLQPVRLRGKQEVVTAAELRPPAPGRPGVLAVAYTERDASKTLIMLCDPADGKPYRYLVSHLQDVRQLAFSASRPLLASVADDQTVCVWSLADLDRAVGQITGLGVSDVNGKKAVIRRVEPEGAAAKAGLAEGDVLEKVGAPGAQPKPVKDAADFLLTVSARRPGDQVEVTVAGKGAVKLPVGRGVDERKPLFSLFLLGNKSKLPDWIGWSPAGPYDYSSPAAEAHLGWHTNTGDPAAPVSYAAAREYWKDYYREGILRYLAAEADLGRALQKWNADHPKPETQAALRFLRPDGALPTERADAYLVRQPVRALRIGINEDYALDDKHVLRWRLTRTDGGKVKANAAETSGQAPRDGKEWRADLSGVEWQRGEYRVRFGLHGRADGPELASETEMLRFQPPAPVVVLRQQDGKALNTTEQKPLVVEKNKLALQIDVQAPVGQVVEVQFAHFLNGLPQKNLPAPPAGAGVFKQEFKLQQGLNRLMVWAINKGALAGREAEERAVAEVWVAHKPRHELPPRITALRLEPEPEVKRMGGKDVWVVDRPDVRLTGKVEAAGILIKADWSAGGAPKAVLPPREAQTAEFVIDLKLKADQLVPVQLRAQSMDSDENMEERWLIFYPPLPDVTADPRDSQDVLTEKITLKGTFRPATKDPFDLLFRVASPEGKVKPFKPEVDQKAGKWKVELTLFPGVNTIEAFVANKWRGGRAVDRVLSLVYRRPPQITASPKEVEAVETNKVGLAITVEGPADRKLTAIKVNRKQLRFFEPGKPEMQGDRWIWKKVELPEVFVNDGDRNLDALSIQAVTDEGESRPAVVRVVHKKNPRPPRAWFVSPVAADTTERPEYPVFFRVESERPLEWVEIHGGREVYQADLKKVEQEGAFYVLQGEAQLTLKHGTNTLELVAVNSDGRSPRAGAEVPVSYKEPDVMISIDQIEPMGGKGAVQQVLKPVYGMNGDLSFPEAPRSLVWLVGQVRWSDPKAKALDDRSLQVVAKVGDCRQFPVELGPRGKEKNPDARPFRVPLVLIAPQNRIKIDVPSVGQEEHSRREFELACAEPAHDQRLHVLIVGVDVKDREELKKRVLDALAVDPDKRPPGVQGEFIKEPPFKKCFLYHVLTGDVDRPKVEAQLVEINNQIRDLERKTHWLNDVVLIYYQGEDVEVPGKKERWLKTSRNFQFPKAPPEDFAIPCNALPRVPGVQLLLLNVPSTPDTGVAGTDWGGDPDTGCLRYACHNRTEVSTANPALLALLQEAIRKNGRLGEIVNYLNDLVRLQPMKFSSPLVVLDKYQQSRQISGYGEAGPSRP